MTPKGQIIKGYKATDGNMRCLGFQYEMGKWYEYDGLIKLCKSGFHFCPHMSGVWSYYNDSDTRIFEVEAEEVENKFEPGADLKYVAKRIRFIREIKVGSNRNTGDWNTGDCNTGNRNTGDCNAGNRNTGDCNTGDCNTGDCNTGNWNTGDGNVGDKHAGFLNIKPEPVIIFDEPFTGKLTDEIKELIYDLSYALMKNDPICPDSYLKIPNATIAKIKKLHQAHIDARNKENIL
jgi:hypothetical protein